MMRAAGLLLAVLCAAELVAPAAADQAFDAVQLVCLPKTQYFSASRRYLWDMTPHFDYRSAAVSFVAPESLKAHPFVCAWKGYSIKITAPDYHANDPENSCAIQQPTPVEATLNGKPLACFAQSRFPSDDPRASVTVTGQGADSATYPVATEVCAVTSRREHMGDADMKLHCKTAMVNDFANARKSRK